MSGTPERACIVVDRGALAHNMRTIVAASGRARVMAVVKADGYGHGAALSADIALANGATDLAVHTVGEAEQLRAAGVGAPILVLGALTGAEWGRAAGVNAEVVVWAPEAVGYADASGVTRIHLKLDSGMGRLGVRIDESAALVDAARVGRGNVAGLMTHFATADDLEGEHAGFFREQLLRFRSAVQRLREIFPDATVHAANSAATFRDPDARFDMVRCGIALYGCSPFHEDPTLRDLRPAMSLVSHLALTKTILSRESVGYGRTWRAERGTQIGLIPVGYADGYSRAYANVAEVLVNGRRVPVIGAVSMDSLTVDLGPESVDRVGDEVVLLGRQGDEMITAEELAAWRHTINYEVTCAMGPRLPRVHVG